MALGGTEYKRLLTLVDLVHEQLYPVAFPFLDLDGAVELRLAVALALFDLAFDDLVVGGIQIVVESGGDLLHLERGQETIVDAFFQRVDVNRIAEISVSVDVVPSLRRCGQSELNRRREVVENIAPIALVIGATTMAFIDHDKVEKILGIVAEIWRGLAILIRPTQEGLKDSEEDTGVLGHPAFPADFVGLDLRTYRLSCETAKAVRSSAPAGPIKPSSGAVFIIPR